MSFTVKNGTQIVYSLPSQISDAGTVLTYPASGTTTTWSNISSHHIPGTITMWYPSSGDTLQANNNGFSPEIDGIVQSDWYLCDGKNINGFDLPNMTHCVPVGSSHGQVFTVDGNTQITQNIPTPSHSHVYQFTESQGVSVTTQSSGAHNHGCQTSHTFLPADTRVKGSPSERNVIKNITQIQTSGEVHTNNGTHTHGAQITIPHTYDDTTNVGGNKIFHHYKMYYIIYLP